MTVTCRGITLAVVSLFVLPLVIACGGGDDAGVTDPTSTIMTSAAGPTVAASPSVAAADAEETAPVSATSAVASPSASVSPTAAPTQAASPTRDTSRPIATRDPEPVATEHGGDSDDSEVLTHEEDALLATLLAEEDLPDGWTVEDTDVADDVDDGQELCGAGPFPQRDQKIAEVEGEYAFEDASAPLFLLQNLVLFPEDIARDAMDWAREASSCSEWVDDEGTVIQVVPLESPGLGDDSHAAHFSFDAGDGQIVEGDWVFIRVGGMISTIAYLGQQGVDLAPFHDIMVTATDKMEAAAGAETGRIDPDFDPDVQAVLIDLLLTQEEMPASWTLTSSGPGEEDDSDTAFCNVPDFPWKDTRLGDVEAEFVHDPSTGPFLNQQITAFPAMWFWTR